MTSLKSKLQSSRCSAGIFPLTESCLCYCPGLSSMSNGVQIFSCSAKQQSVYCPLLTDYSTTCVKTQIHAQKHVQMYQQEKLVNHILHINAQSHNRTHRQTRTLSHESACEFRDTGEEKCKFSSLQVSDIDIHGEMNVSVCERMEEVARRERF